MTNNEITLEYLPFVEELCDKWKVDEDCKQMFFVAFLQKDNELLNDLHNRGELKYWICGMLNTL